MPLIKYQDQYWLDVSSTEALINTDLSVTKSNFTVSEALHESQEESS